jgi:hypothetical protein
MSTSGISSLTAQLGDFLTERQEEQQGQLATAADMTTALPSTLQTDTVSISSAAYAKSQGSNSNMMSRNFVGGYERDTSYLDAKAAGAAAVQNLEASMQSSMTSLMEFMGSDAMWYGSERMKNAKVMKDTTESHKEVFDNIKGNIEEKAAEALAPKDENGEVIEQIPAASTGTANAAAAAVAPQAAEVDVEVNLDGVAAAAKALSSIDVSV